MKPKKLPRIIILWLALLGFILGFMIGGIILAFNIIIWVMLILCCLILFLLVKMHYRVVLEEWGLSEPPKKKERGRTGNKN